MEPEPQRNYARIAYLADYYYAKLTNVGFFDLSSSYIPSYFSIPDTVDRYQYSYIINSGLYICLELNQSGFYVIPGGSFERDEDMFEAIVREMQEEHPQSNIWDLQMVLGSVGIVTSDWTSTNDELCRELMIIKPFEQFDDINSQSAESINHLWVRLVDCIEIYERGGMPKNMMRLALSAFQAYYESWNYLSPHENPDIKETGLIWFDQLPLLKPER